MKKKQWSSRLISLINIDINILNIEEHTKDIRKIQNIQQMVLRKPDNYMHIDETILVCSITHTHK